MESDKDRDRLELMLNIVARGINTRAEVAWLMCRALGCKHPSGTVARTIRLAETLNYVIVERVQMFAHGTVMLMRLSPKGELYCLERAFTFGPPEWEQMIRGHQGSAQPRHTAMVLTFAFQARKRGYHVDLLPTVLGDRWEPDACVFTRKKGRSMREDELYYVEVETRSRLEKVEAGKWDKALAGARELGAGLGIVALMPYARRKLSEWVPSAWVTDLSSLCQGQESLWYMGRAYHAKTEGAWELL